MHFRKKHPAIALPLVAVFLLAALFQGSAAAGEKVKQPATGKKQWKEVNSKSYWYSMRMMRQKIGWARITEKEIKSGDEVRKVTEDVFFMKLNRGGGEILEDTKTSRAVSDPDGRLITYHTESSSPGQESTITRIIRKGEKLIIINTVGATCKAKEVDVPEKFSGELFREFMAKEYKVGLKVSGKVFNTGSQRVIDESYEIIAREDVEWMGRTVEAWVVNMTEKSGLEDMTITVYVTDDEKEAPLKMTIAGGMIAVIRTSEQDAKDLSGDFDAGIEFSVKVSPPVRDPESVRAAKVVLSGAPDAIYEFANQKKTKDLGGGRTEWLFTSPDFSVDNALQIPVAAAEGIEKFLKPTVYIQSDSGKIKEKAKEIIGDEKNALHALRKISQWVYFNIGEKNFSVGFASAAETLKSRTGDCTEHSVLTIALARAVGIPARGADGFGFSGDAFIYHMWVEGYVGKDTWVAVDPALGQPVPDALHIKLYHGDVSPEASLDSTVRILKTLGRMKVEILEIKREGMTEWKKTAPQKKK
ncbi:MAG: transglutaminase domain-containing protein [Planctomycetota bacterium]|nr:MAG: transglutaminase domain-containing protein [Planctomycetota bacterium]